MSFINPRSVECIKTELDLFTLPPTQTSIEGGKWVHYKPISSLTDDAPIEFVVPGHGDEYTDLAQTLLHITASIVKADGTNIADADVEKVGPINNWMHSLFSQVDVYMNQKLVSPQNNTYAYRAYLENLLNYGEDAKNTHLTTVIWSDDTAGHMDSATDDNLGFKNRRIFTGKSLDCDMVGHLHIDICNQNKFLLNGVELRFRLVRSRDSFSIMTSNDNTTYRVKIKQADLLIRRCKINPSVLLAHSKTLESGTAKYPITRVELKSMTLPSGIKNKMLDNVFLGQLPKRIVVGLVDNTAFNGDFKKNPFNFQNYKINYFSIYVDGEQVPSKPLQPDFSTERGEKTILSYATLFTGTGINYSDSGNAIPRWEYSNGYALFAFDLTPDLSASNTEYWNLVRNGNLRIEMGFEDALAATVNCIVYAEFDNVIEIDRYRNVIVDFGA